jgi:hypothetical protein
LHEVKATSCLTGLANHVRLRGKEVRSIDRIKDQVARDNKHASTSGFDLMDLFVPLGRRAPASLCGAGNTDQGALRIVEMADY